MATFAPLVTRLATDVVKGRLTDSGQQENVISKATTDKMVETLSRARGAALKVGQMLSIQDDAIIPKHIADVFERVRQSADYMPFSQVESQLIYSFGKDWETSLFQSFEQKPFAAASIGQVHRAVTKSGEPVAVKIQYPKVAESIDSDVENLKLILPLLRLPESFYPHDAINTAKEELIWETDYIREGSCQARMRTQFENDVVVKIPKVYEQLSSKTVLTCELILNAITLDECLQLDQETRNFIARQMIRIGFHQLFTLRFMQTDPNWSNYFWDPKNSNIWMIDFGAAREYSKEFIDLYIEIINAAVTNEKEVVLEKSREIGFLTGYESEDMNRAHVNSVMVLGDFIRCEGDYDFAKQKISKDIVSKEIPVMVKGRLTAPPKEVYSLHRALAGIFLTATKLQAQCHSLDLWREVYNLYHSSHSYSQEKSS